MIDNLKQLRYLGLTGINIEKLPESLCKLYKLETLQLDCMELKELPKGITSLINLRHLVFIDDLIAEKLLIPDGIGKLTRLQTLPPFVVDNRRQSIKLSELKDLNDLRTTLKIEELKKIKDKCKSDVIMANLKSKKHLSRLCLNWNVDLFGEKIPQHKVELAEEVLENLQPHNNIQTLAIQCYVGLKFPNWLGNPSYCKLAHIWLYGCRKFEFLPILAELPALEQLNIEFMKNLQSFVGEESCNENSMSSTASEEFT